VQQEIYNDDGPDEAWLEEEEKRREEAKRHPLMILSHDDMMNVHEWRKTADGDLKAVARGMLEEAANAFVKDDVEEQAREIGEMIEIVAWYHTLISAKVGRAVRGLLKRDEVVGEMAEILSEARHSDARAV
jgi:hypothetical protein